MRAVPAYFKVGWVENIQSINYSYVFIWQVSPMIHDVQDHWLYLFLKLYWLVAKLEVLLILSHLGVVISLTPHSLYANS